ETKTRLFLLAAKSPTLKHRRIALRQLFRLDHPQAVPLLIDALNHLPATPKGEYWLGDAGPLALIVTLTDDPRAWQALDATAKRVDVGQRMEIINVMNYTIIEGRQRAQRIEFLRRFL